MQRGSKLEHFIQQSNFKSEREYHILSFQKSVQPSDEQKIQFSLPHPPWALEREIKGSRIDYSSLKLRAPGPDTRGYRETELYLERTADIVGVIEGVGGRGSLGLAKSCSKREENVLWFISTQSN